MEFSHSRALPPDQNTNFSQRSPGASGVGEKGVILSRKLWKLTPRKCALTDSQEICVTKIMCG